MIGFASPEETATLGRAFAESIMSATCEIREPSTETITDRDTGATTDVPGALIYTGKCHVQPGGGGAVNGGGRSVSVVGGEAFSYDFLISLPASATGVTGGHEVTITGSPDPDLIGRLVEVQRVDRGDYRTARRLQCNGRGA